ncbi:MAG: hypothetical protein AAF957_03515 [Planctomycetota bacterium]
MKRSPSDPPTIVAALVLGAASLACARDQVLESVAEPRASEPATVEPWQRNAELRKALRQAIRAAGCRVNELTAFERECVCAHLPPRWSNLLASLGPFDPLPDELRPMDLDNLTILRRLQGRPDPLVLDVQELTRGPYREDHTPRLAVWLRLHEEETEATRVSGSARDRVVESPFSWHVELLDAQGHPAPLPRYEAHLGTYSHCTYLDPLEPGVLLGARPSFDGILAKDGHERFRRQFLPHPRDEVWPIQIDVGSLTRPTFEGTYMLRVLLEPDSAGLIRGPIFAWGVLHRSRPITIEWR